MVHEFKWMWKFSYSYRLPGKFWNKLFLVCLFVNQEWRLLGGCLSFMQESLFDAPPRISHMLHFPAISCSFQSENSWSPRLGRNPWVKSMLWCLLTFQDFFWSHFVFGIYRFLYLRSVQQCIENDFRKREFILVWWLFHLGDCSEYLVYYSVGNGGFYSLIFPLYMLLLSIRKKKWNYFLFTVMDNMNLKVCMWIWNSISALLYLDLTLVLLKEYSFFYGSWNTLFFFFLS